ncbi:MAG: serine protease [Leptospiraceae bacterium]|nr:serine protease [Leptospiraceae bacterium]MDW7976703.1 trypsin-like peptidase domain-containing protein [Leptospiraceae bacterium]
MKTLTLFFIFRFFAQTEEQDLFSSVVYVETYGYKYNYEFPWQRPSIQQNTGSGFIIEVQNRKYIFTNAHVVSNAIQIRVKRANQSSFSFAKVVHIAHDCDLALLDIDENLSSRENFYDNAKALSIGETPQINSPVIVVGYPIGGKRISITKGIVSRIDFDTYTHSGIDSHLILQVDAAINPGNSGGPAIQNGKVVGMAFQVLRSGENLGYLIPPPVLKKFLRDIQLDSAYDGYIELGVLTQTTENPMLKKALNLPKRYQQNGLYVYDILPGSSAEGFLEQGDVILEIQGYPITENGEIFLNGEYRDYIELVDNLEKDEKIQVKVYRKGKVIDISFPAKITHALDFQRKSYDYPPVYVLFSGLVFQPLEANLLNAFSSKWLEHQRSEIFYSYYFALQNQRGIHDQIIILNNILPFGDNQKLRFYLYKILHKVNGKEIKNLKELHDLLHEETKRKKFIVFEFFEESLPMILSSEKLVENHQRIMKFYQIQNDHFIKDKR